MAHYLLKKRVMMELKQQREQQQQQQHQHGDQQQVKVANIGVDISDSKLNKQTQPYSVHDQTVNVLLKESLDKCKQIDASGPEEALNLCKKFHTHSDEHERTGFVQSIQDMSGRAPVQNANHSFQDATLAGRSVVYRDDTGSQRMFSELETLNEKEEKQRLISKIVSIVRETVKVPIHNLDLDDKSMLHCMNILANPLCELNNYGMMHMQGCDQQQISLLQDSTSGLGNQLSKPTSSDGFGQLLLEGAVWPGHNPDLTDLAVARPSPGKQLSQGTPPSNVMSGLSAKSHTSDTDAYGANAYLPAVQSPSAGTQEFQPNPGTALDMSAVENIERGHKSNSTKVPYLFNGHQGQGNEYSGEHRPRTTSDPDHVTMVPVDLGSRGTLTSDSDVQLGVGVMKASGDVFGSKEHNLHPFVSKSSDSSDFSLSCSDKPAFSRPQSFPEQHVFSQPCSFHGQPDSQASPVVRSHQGSPMTGSVCDSSSQEPHIFDRFASGERDRGSIQASSSASTLSSFAQSESHGLPGTTSMAKAAPSQQNVISSSCRTVCSSKAAGGAKRRNTASSDTGFNGFPVTSSGRNKGLGKTNEPKFDCQVCGDVAAGFHCGAYVCEACKKFYLRCLKNDQNLLTCPKSQRCEINKENRSHCQYCRYQKCLSLGMYRPGREDDKKLKVNFKAIPCKVCGASSSGFHFGAITCEGCKGFFRRMLKENLHQKFTCSSGNSCDITSANRTFCKACRFNKCLKIGMTLEGTRLGRQSNSMKRSTLMAYKMHDFDGPPSKVVATDKVKMEPADDGYHTETSSYAKPRDGIKDSECSVVEDLDDVSLEVIDPLELDGNLLDVSDSPKGKMSVGKTTKYLQRCAQAKANHGIVGFSEDINMSEQTTERGGKISSQSPTDLYLTSQHSESLGGTWNGAFSVSDGSSRALSTESTSRCDDQELSWPPPKHDVSKINTERSELKVNRNSADDSQHSAGNQGNSAGVGKPGLPSFRSKQAGVEIYSDPERLTDYLVDIYSILDGMKEVPESMKQYKLDIRSPQSIWNFTMQGFVHDSYIMLRFLKAVPGFRTLPQDKQIKLCQETVYPISLLYHSQGYDLEQCKIKFFCYTDEVRELLFTSFPHFRGMMSHFEQCGRWMAEMKIDQVELAFITVIFVLRATEQTIHDSAVRGYLETTTDILMKYCDRKDSTRAGILIARMAELERASFEHHQMAALTIKENPHMSFGQLWQEIFIPE